MSALGLTQSGTRQQYGCYDLNIVLIFDAVSLCTREPPWMVLRNNTYHFGFITLAQFDAFVPPLTIQSFTILG